MKPSEALIQSKSPVEGRAGPATSGGRPAPDAASPEGRAEERELVRRAQGGDEAAFRRLVEQNADRAYALALRILKSASDAEEVAQDAFVRAWRALPRFRGESAFSSWLHRIVARRAFDRVAVLKARRLRETPVESAEDLPHAATGPEPEAGTNARKLERLLAELPEVPRTVVTLYYYHDRSVDEVAEILNMPANTVKTHLRRARISLHAAWTREEGTP
jgi:RNA polymerase sigma-70 factor (ECF subfamily)